MTAQPHYTPARHEWLRTLRYEPLMAAQRRGTVVGFQCFQLGWTQWAIGSADNKVHGEVLTEEGLRILLEWQVKYPPTSRKDNRLLAAALQ